MNFLQGTGGNGVHLAWILGARETPGTSGLGGLCVCLYAIMSPSLGVARVSGSHKFSQQPQGGYDDHLMSKLTLSWLSQLLCGRIMIPVLLPGSVQQGAEVGPRWRLQSPGLADREVVRECLSVRPHVGAVFRRKVEATHWATGAIPSWDWRRQGWSRVCSRPSLPMEVAVGAAALLCPWLWGVERDCWLESCTPGRGCCPVGRN